MRGKTEMITYNHHENKIRYTLCSCSKGKGQRGGSSIMEEKGGGGTHALKMHVIQANVQT